MGIPHMGISKSLFAFPYWDLHMEKVNPYGKKIPFGDFCLNYQMVMNSISERVSDWTVPVWKWAISWNQFQNGISDGSPFGDPNMDTGSLMFWIPFPYTGIFCKPFPFGDPHMEMGSRLFWIPIWKWQFTIPIWGFTVSCFLQMQKQQFLSRWCASTAWLNGRPKLQSPFPHGDSPFGNGMGDLTFFIWGVPIPK